MGVSIWGFGVTGAVHACGHQQWHEVVYAVPGHAVREDAGDGGMVVYERREKEVIWAFWRSVVWSFGHFVRDRLCFSSHVTSCDEVYSTSAVSLAVQDHKRDITKEQVAYSETVAPRIPAHGQFAKANRKVHVLNRETSRVAVLPAHFLHVSWLEFLAKGMAHWSVACMRGAYESQQHV